jgi:O-antigen biosynthesis protein WbqP
MIKRAFDFTLAFLLLICLFVPMVIIGIAILLTSEGPVLYWSYRVGKKNHPFNMPKFRSMRINTPTVPTHLLNEPALWLTPIGSFLRQTSLDELPQLWSIIQGDMSFVGPRPALTTQVDLIALRTQANVDELTPGLTGWAQINGRDSISTEQKAQLDAQYLARKTFWFDILILWRTVLQVARKEEVSH